VLADPGDPGESLTALLCPAGQALEVARRVQAMYGTVTGIGTARDDPADAWESWREAVLAVRIAAAVERQGPVAAWADLGVYRMLARMPRPELTELAAQVRDLPGDLARTVETYLDHGGHALETARELGVHRQTLYYRLGKAERVTGLDLADGEDRLLLHLGLKAAGLMPAR
jgi:DNA-binding PucR family transcriptional regulator